MVLYFDPETKQIWGEGSGSKSESHMDVEDQLPPGTSGGNVPPSHVSPMVTEFDDDEINAAARVLSMVSPVVIVPLEFYR